MCIKNGKLSWGSQGSAIYFVGSVCYTAHECGFMGVNYVHGERLFARTFTRIALIILLTVITLSLALMVHLQSHSAILIENYTVDQLYQIKHSTDMMLENARRTLLGYSINGDVLKLVNQADAMDSLELYETLRRIEKLRTSKVQPEYVCFYNQDTNSIFYQAKQYPADAFPDQALVEMLRSGSTYTNYYPILRRSPDYERLYAGVPIDQNMYTFIYTSSPDGQMKNAVILNIPVDNIDRAIGAQYADIGDEIMIINTALDVIRGNSTFAYGSVVTDEPAIAGLTAYSESGRYFVDTIRGQKSLISFVKSDVADWMYLRITPYAVVTNAALAAIAKSALTAIALLIPLLGLGAMATRNIHRAFKRRMAELDHSYR